MSDFEESMRRLAKVMSPEAKTLVRYVLASEHKNRFSGRTTLPEMYATLALSEAKNSEGS